MILETFHFGLEVTPHSSKDLPLGMISEKLVAQIKDFIIYTNQIILELSKSDSLVSVDLLKKHGVGKRYDDMYQKLIVEHGVADKSRLKSYTAEYVEAIYIVTFLLWKYLKITQEQTAELLGIKCKNYNEKMGITPVT